MKGIISRYKSDIVEYITKEHIPREDVVMMCTRADVDLNRHSIDELVVLEKPWRGFDLEAITLYVCKPKADEPKIKAAPKAAPKLKVLQKPAVVVPAVKAPAPKVIKKSVKTAPKKAVAKKAAPRKKASPKAKKS